MPEVRLQREGPQRGYQVVVEVGYGEKPMLVSEARRFAQKLDRAIKDAETKNRPPGRAFYK